MNGRWVCNPNPGPELPADEAQVVGRFEVANPVVEETDAVRLAKAIQFVESDRPLAPALSKSLKKSSNPPGVYSSMMRAKYLRQDPIIYRAKTLSIKENCVLSFRPLRPDSG